MCLLKCDWAGKLSRLVHLVDLFPEFGKDGWVTVDMVQNCGEAYTSGVRARSNIVSTCDHDIPLTVLVWVIASHVGKSGEEVISDFGIFLSHTLLCIQCELVHRFSSRVGGRKSLEKTK